jgi:hypothetical protein
MIREGAVPDNSDSHVMHGWGGRRSVGAVVEARRNLRHVYASLERAGLRTT